MNGGQDHIVFVAQRRTGLVAGRVGRVQRQLGEEAFARRIAAGQPGQLLQVGAAHARVVEDALQLRPVPLQRGIHVGGPGPARLAQRRVGGDEFAPLLARRRARLELAHGRQRIGRLRHGVHQLAGGGRADAGHQLRHPETGQPRARVLGPAQHGQHVLEMGGLEKAQAAEFHERDVAPGQFELQRGAVAGGAKQRRLRLERGPALALRQHLVGHPARLAGFVADAHQLGALRRGAIGPQRFGVAFGGQPDDRVGRIQDGLGGAVIALQRDHLGAAGKLLREIEDVAHARGAERIDRLRVVAHHGQAAAVGLHGQQDGGLQAVGVLVLVDQDMVEARADIGGQPRVAHHLGPVQQQVVVIEHVLLLLGQHIGLEQALELGLPGFAPRERLAQHLGQRRLAVDHARINGQAGALEREAVVGGRQPQLVAHDAHQLLGVAAIVHGKGLRQADARRAIAQQPRAHAVERAGPRQRRRRVPGAQAHHALQHAAHAPFHFLRGARTSTAACAADRRHAGSGAPRGAPAYWSCPTRPRRSPAAPGWPAHRPRTRRPRAARGSVRPGDHRRAPGRGKQVRTWKRANWTTLYIYTEFPAFRSNGRCAQA
ncbi:Uncharacterised protein [Bordetella parapertussis]|nr:Uncharacterised protein [Bordetella parapertussis]SUV57182.1 Uncharacterised protein [Bordetella parapertussis]SUW98979.1 Uncharacterised protein [Bordetella parapertussis]VEF53469.1 Uncharacterised protein [Bordetella parapertussis]VTR35610.1 Uncharacterised protein [Bordetella parapertussis]